jgi:hypothetical protein
MRTIGPMLRERRSFALLLGLVVGSALAAGCSSSRAGNGAGSNGSSDSGVSDDSSSLGVDAGPLPSSPIRPTFGPTVTTSVPPPPISGGTLLVMHDGSRAVASDPDRDRIYGVNLSSQAIAFTIALKAGDEPGRLVEDGSGHVHVALRGVGALLTIDPKSGSVVARRSICPAPRGIAWDASSDLVWVACATGELVALPSAGGAVTRTIVLERDLRDVIVSNGSLAVTKFRSAEVLRVASDGTIARRDALPSPVSTFVPHVAWRAVAGPSGTLVALHQAESTASLPTHVQGGYGGGCGGGPSPGPPPSPPLLPQFLPLPLWSDSGVDSSTDIDSGHHAGCDTDGGAGGGGRGSGFDAGLGGCFGLESGAVLSVLTMLRSDGTVAINREFPAVLPVDVAVSRDGSSMAAVAPGNAFSSGLGTVFLFTQCGDAQGPAQTVGTSGTSEQPIAVAFDAANHLLVQTREPAALWIVGLTSGTRTRIPLSTATREDTGHDIFHTQAGGMIACASCHPEGRDDGHVWTLDGQRRRTPSLRGTIKGTAPYHWPGDMPNLSTLVNDVYTLRMNGTMLDPAQMGALNGWVQTVPAPPAPAWVDASAAQRGHTLFARADVGCSVCHSGPQFTNNLTVDVGTGGTFQVPPLVGVGWRTPLLHDGCATTIADRFGACATPQHGSIESLSSQDISDLTAYLETL